MKQKRPTRGRVGRQRFLVGQVTRVSNLAWNGRATQNRPKTSRLVVLRKNSSQSRSSEIFEVGVEGSSIVQKFHNKSSTVGSVAIVNDTTGGKLDWAMAPKKIQPIKVSTADGSSGV